MKREDDKWLEQQLMLQPQINKDGFNDIVMTEIEVFRKKEHEMRKNILLGTYVTSFIILLIATPWGWLSTWLNDYQSLLTIFTASEQGTPFPIISLSILFVISFTIFIFGQETN
ncbi:MAG: hypothetical protein JKY84_02775 [Emcibacteraceae bacterium]|nr:hypothetical protein [Emcibacteraceae bacterium]